MKVLLTACLLLLAACNGVPSSDEANRPFFAPGHELALPQPAELGRDAEWLQHITVRHDGDAYAFDGRISVTAESFQLIGIDGLGRRTMSIDWNRSGQVNAMRAEWLPPQVRPGPMLADIVLLYWPRDVLRRALQPSGATLREIGKTRIVSLGGKEVLHIDYLGGGRLRYRNNGWGYEIEVQSVEVVP
ncbi:DUF3261 domain-containing protein [Dongia sp.]|uniref:DUF3261 domain-containing protein n=1 Tax=Dongia sp. TaxID=1977262 RepID=UPI0035B2D1CD